MTAIEQFVAGLEQRFGTARASSAEGVFEAVLRGRQRITVTFDEAASTATIAAPVEPASRELPTADLNDLLKRNFPDSRMAGSMLVAPPSHDSLVMINVIPLCSATPELLAGIAMAQGCAALDLANAILADRKEAGDAGDDDEEDLDFEGLDDDDRFVGSALEHWRAAERDGAAPNDEDGGEA